MNAKILSSLYSAALAVSVVQREDNVNEELFTVSQAFLNLLAGNLYAGTVDPQAIIDATPRHSVSFCMKLLDRLAEEGKRQAEELEEEQRIALLVLEMESNDWS